MDKEVMKPKEAAAFLGLSPARTYALIEQNEIPHARIGKRIMLRRQALLQWLADKESKNGVLEG